MVCNTYQIILVRHQMSERTSVWLSSAANLSRPPRALHRVFTRHALATFFAEYF